MKNLKTDFGALGSPANDTQAFLDAAASGAGEIYIPAGSYYTYSEIPLNSNNQTWRGEARGAVTIYNHSSGSCFQSYQNVVNNQFINLTITREAATTSLNHGISTAGCRVEFMKIDNCVINNHYNGLNLGYTGYSTVNECYVYHNYNDGIKLTNNLAAGGAMQWTFRNTLCELNDGYGVLVKSEIGCDLVAVGEWNNLSTFANKKGGLAALGTPQGSIQGLRVLGGFIGQDSGNAICLDTYAGFTHKIVGTYIELPGTFMAGRAQDTKTAGYGMLITANNDDVVVSGCVIRGAALSGILSAGKTVTLSGNSICYNGSDDVIGNRNGLYLIGGRAIVTGNNIIGHAYGMDVNTDNHIISGNNLEGNTIPIYKNGTSAVSLYSNNIF